MRFAERPVLVAPDSFKGTFNAAQVAGAIGRGLERAGLMPPDLCPVADGGEGTLDALLPQLGGELIAVTVKGPLGRAGEDRVRVGGGRRDGDRRDGDGVRARAGRRGERDAWAATTYGTGELIAAAAQAGAQVILVAVGGSATTDGGAGAIEAIEAAGGIGKAKIVVLTDVRTTFEDAPKVFGPQKGADEEMIKRLEKRLDELAQTTAEGPARRADDRRRRRALRRTVGRARRGARAGRAVRARRARLRRADEGVAGRRDRRGQARRSDAAGQARGRDRHAGPTGRRAAARDRRHDAMDGFAKRIIDLQMVQEATNLEEMEAAGERLGEALASGRPRGCPTGIAAHGWPLGAPPPRYPPAISARWTPRTAQARNTAPSPIASPNISQTSKS